MQLSVLPVDPDLNRAARALMDLYGPDAAKVAEKRARNLPSDMPESASSRWRRIADAIRRLEAGRLPHDSPK